MMSGVRAFDWSRYRAKIVSSELKIQGRMPKLELSLLGPFFNCTATNKQRYNCGMDVDATCGMSRSSEVALLKSLVEWVERMAVREHISVERPENRTSDGFAAFPKVLCLWPKEIARKNALNEAIERFSWKQWWLDHRISFRIFPAPDSVFLNMVKNSFINSDFLIEKMMVVEPKINGAQGSLKIIVAKLAGRGYVTGGAFHQKSKIALDQAIGELMRHCR